MSSKHLYRSMLIICRPWRKHSVMAWGTSTRAWVTLRGKRWSTCSLAVPYRCWWPLAVSPGAWVCLPIWWLSWIPSIMTEKHTRKFLTLCPSYSYLLIQKCTKLLQFFLRKKKNWADFFFSFYLERIIARENVKIEFWIKMLWRFNTLSVYVTGMKITQCPMSYRWLVEPIVHSPIRKVKKFFTSLV